MRERQLYVGQFHEGCALGLRQFSLLPFRGAPEEKRSIARYLLSVHDGLEDMKATS